eukprot:TRINITY_DN13629_c0_g1_i27.p1 TRINITY_DN13629_c0_g1~~TRINITY_DN13629_c0_g1_i27.p1  ORF type:complete len:581 (+),score=127.32 TRINITY_DN13629_c0_g1_i27:181-1743(+)
MNGIKVFLMVSLSLVSCEQLKNIDYMSYGYDVYTSSPLTTSKSSDPGFRTKPIFNFTYKEDQQSSDGRWEVPDLTTVIRNDDCSLHFSTKVFTGATGYAQVLNIYVDSSFEDLSGRFKGSDEYKQVDNNTVDRNNIYTISHTDCTTYLAFIRSSPWPSVTKEFKDAVSALPYTYDEDEYMSFLQTYGTHFVYMMDMGSRYSCVNRMTKKSWDNFLGKDYEIRNASSGLCYKSSGAAEKGVYYDEEVVREFSSDCADKKITSVGERPVKGRDAKVWLERSKENPMPVRYKLKKISDLLNFDILQEVEDVDEIRSNIEAALADYCEYLKDKGVISDCEEPMPDPPVPALIQSCRLCSSKCGGNFSIRAGAFRNFGSNNPYISYNAECKSPFTTYSVPGYTYMCCQKEKEYREGSCRVCTKCGDEYSENMGSVYYTQGSFEPNILSYGDSCRGDLHDRGLKSKPSFCCKKEPICSLCLSCGGDYPYEEGVFGRSLSMYYEGKGEECEGHYRGCLLYTSDAADE